MATKKQAAARAKFAKAARAKRNTKVGRRAKQRSAHSARSAAISACQLARRTPRPRAGTTPVCTALPSRPNHQ